MATIERKKQFFIQISNATFEMPKECITTKAPLIGKADFNLEITRNSKLSSDRDEPNAECSGVHVSQHKIECNHFFSIDSIFVRK